MFCSTPEGFLRPCDGDAQAWRTGSEKRNRKWSGELSGAVISAVCVRTARHVRAECAQELSRASRRSVLGPPNVPPLSSGRIRKPELSGSDDQVRGVHHGREGGGAGWDEARPSASTACWAARLLPTSQLSGVFLRWDGVALAIPEAAILTGGSVPVIAMESMPAARADEHQTVYKERVQDVVGEEEEEARSSLEPSCSPCRGCGCECESTEREPRTTDVAVAPLPIGIPWRGDRRADLLPVPKLASSSRSLLFSSDVIAGDRHRGAAHRSSSAQRTAVKQRPHQQTTSY